MAKDVRIISARVGFLFRQDQLRLSMLTADPIIEIITQEWMFKSVNIQTPPATFGQVPSTFPPGLVCQLGVHYRDSEMVPIRTLFIEPKRIVVDVAGPSDWGLSIYHRLSELLSHVVSPDGTRILGDYFSIVHHSDISSKADVYHGQLASPLALEQLLSHDESLRELQARPRWTVHFWRPSEEFPGQSVVRAAIIEPRSGATSEDDIVFSSAPLSTDQHIAWLEDLESLGRNRDDA